MKSRMKYAAATLILTAVSSLAQQEPRSDMTIDVIPNPTGTVSLVRFRVNIEGIKGKLFVSLTAVGECSFHPVLNVELNQSPDQKTVLTGYLSLDSSACEARSFKAVLSIDKRERSVWLTKDFTLPETKQ